MSDEYTTLEDNSIKMPRQRPLIHAIQDVIWINDKGMTIPGIDFQGQILRSLPKTLEGKRGVLIFVENPT